MNDMAEIIGAIFCLIFIGFLFGYLVGVTATERTRCEYCGHIVATRVHKDDRVIIDGVMYHRECYDNMLKESIYSGE